MSKTFLILKKLYQSSLLRELFMKKFTVYVLILFLHSCVPGSQSGEITLMSWNVQNLFDDKKDGEEYGEFDPEKGEWTRELYHKRLSLLTRVIEDAGNPDVLLLQEVENRDVLEALSQYLDGYSWIVFPGDPVSPAGTGVLSRYPVTQVSLHYPGEAEVLLRPLMEVHISAEGEELILFNNHWKSRRGGASETGYLRRMSSAFLKQRICEILKGNPMAKIILAGDFNENIDEAERGNSVKAFSSEEDSALLGVVSEKSLCRGSHFYSPWEDSGEKGSYWFKESWQTLDHFFISPGLLMNRGVTFKEFILFQKNYMVTHEGVPLKWISRYGRGYSDHLPLICRLTFEKEADPVFPE